jgi:predicted Rossmann fold flavoprotein
MRFFKRTTVSMIFVASNCRLGGIPHSLFALETSPGLLRIGVPMKCTFIESAESREGMWNSRAPSYNVRFWHDYLGLAIVSSGSGTIQLEAEKWDVIVVGAGAAGLLAAARAAERGRKVLLLEKNLRPGIKILMSGGTRCNLTHDTDRKGIVDAYGPPGRFLYSPLAALGPRELVALFEAEGVATKVEETGKIFPVSNKAADVVAALLRRLERSGAKLSLGEPLLSLRKDPDQGFELTTPRRTLSATTVLLTTGGQSYPGSGTTGDGYVWARELGHTIIPPRPALAPITTSATWVLELRGITIPDMTLRVIDPSLPPKKQVIAQRRSSLLFAHFGLTGPAALDVSRAVSGHPKPTTLFLECDFLPDEPEAAVDDRLRQAAVTAGNRQLVGYISPVLPRRLCEALMEQAGMLPDRRSAELPKFSRQELVTAIKRQRIPVTGTLGFKKAEVTAGGVALKEVNSSTMESKIVPGLYFAGEILDLDGPIGGFNFQAAFSTGWLAGENV